MGFFERLFNTNVDLHPPKHKQKSDGRSRRDFFGVVSGVTAGAAVVAVAPKAVASVAPVAVPVPTQKAVIGMGDTISSYYGMSASYCIPMTCVMYYRAMPRGEDS
jgi:hypothetical protein